MELKNFIEVTLYVDSNATRKKNLINIKKITRIQENKICLQDSSEFYTRETSEQIQQKIFECQKPNYYIVNNSKTISSDSVNFIPGKDNSNEKLLKPEHQEIIKPHNNTDTERNLNEF